MKLVRSISRHSSKPPLPNYGSLHDPIKELHVHYIRTLQHTNPNAMSQIIKSYALSQASMYKAHLAFNEIHNPPLPIWNHMIRGLSKGDSPVDALHLFDKMRVREVRGDNLTFIFLSKVCARVWDVLYGKGVHVHVLKLGFGSYLYVCNALINMYGCCGDLCSSRRVFDEMDERDLVSWNSLICGYSQCAKYKEVLGLFDVMRVENVTADAVTMVKIVLACTYLGEWNSVDTVVEYIKDNCVEIDVYLGNTLIDVYGRRGLIASSWDFFDRMKERNIVSWNAMIIWVAKSGDLDAAKKLFDAMPQRDVVSWTSMIKGYSQAKEYANAIRLFEEMMVTKVKPDQITVATILSVCARLGRLDLGKWIRDYIRENSLKTDIHVKNALIDMFCKCGSFEEALAIFHEMKEKDSVSWTSIITGLAINGDSKHALELFSQMLREGIRPIHGTFVGILLACVHAGLVDQGLEFFYSMERDYSLVPESRHYGCVVDLFCRAGNVRRAYEFIQGMPIFVDVVVWRILLSACKVHGDFVLAKIALEKVLELDSSNGGDYIVESNLYASVERWEDAMKIREMIDKCDVLKPLGWSSIELNQEISNPSSVRVVEQL